MQKTALVIDASCDTGLVALADESGTLFEYFFPVIGDIKESLWDIIAKNMSELSLKFSDLECVILGSGPGSYSGMRFAASIAQSIAFALKIPLLEVSSLCGYGPQVESCNYLSVIDARAGGTYVQSVQKKNGEFLSVSEPIVCNNEQLEQQFMKVELVVTPTVDKVCRRIKNRDLHQKIEPATLSVHNFLRAIKVAVGQSANYAADLKYLKKSSAEINNLQR